MTVADRVEAFAKLIGFDAAVFDNIGDAGAFIDLAKDNPVMKQFPLYLKQIGDKVGVTAETDDISNAGESTALTWGNLEKYSVSSTSVVNRL